MDRYNFLLADTHTSSLERTALWVEAQTTESYESASTPPSPSSSSMKASMTPSSNRTTASSEQSISSTSRRRGPPPPLSAASTMRPLHSTVPSSSNMHTVSNQRQLPFPQSPPGTGYPIMLEVGPRRADAERSQSKASRPSIVKKRRPSLLSKLTSLGDWKKDDNGK